MPAMTPKEVILATVQGRVPDRIPVTVSPQGIVRAARGLSVDDFYRLPVEEQAAFRAENMRKYGGDVFTAGYNGTLAILALGGRVKFRKRGAPEVTEPLVEKIAGIDRIDISKIKQDFYYLNDREETKLLVKLAGDEYLVSAGSWGPFTLAELFAGTEQIMRACIKDKNAVRALLDFSLEVIKTYSEEIFDAGVTIGHIAEPAASADMVSKKIFNEFAAPWLEKTFDWYKSKGLINQLHICGNITDRLEECVQCGAEILSLDHKVSMKTAVEKTGGRTVLAGNADPVETIMAGTPESVRAAYLAVFEEVQGCPYIMMPGCDIPSKTPLENITAMRDLAHATPAFWAAKI